MSKIVRHKGKKGQKSWVYTAAQQPPDVVHPTEGSEKLKDVALAWCDSCRGDPEETAAAVYRAYAGPKRIFLYWQPLPKCGRCARRTPLKIIDITKTLSRKQCMEVVAATQEVRALELEDQMEKLGGRTSSTGEMLHRMIGYIRKSSYRDIRRANRPKGLIKQLIAAIEAIETSHELVGRERIDLVCSDGVVSLSCMAALLHGGDFACLEEDSLKKESGATIDELVRVAQEAGFELAPGGADGCVLMFDSQQAEGGELGAMRSLQL